MLVAHPAHQGSAVIFIRPSTSLEIKDTHGSLKLELMLMSCVISCVIASAKSNSCMQSSCLQITLFSHICSRVHYRWKPRRRILVWEGIG